MVAVDAHRLKATMDRRSVSPEEPTDEQKRTLWVGGISEKVTEEILYELFLNAGPLVSVRIPVERETKRQRNFAFVVFHHEESVPYAVELFRDIRLFGSNLRLQNKSTGAGMTPTPPSRQNYSERPLHQRSMSAPYNFAAANALFQQQQQQLVMASSMYEGLQFMGQPQQPIQPPPPMYMNGMIQYANQQQPFIVPPYGGPQHEQQQHEPRRGHDGRHRYSDDHRNAAAVAGGGRHRDRAEERNREAAPYDRRHSSRHGDRRSYDRDGAGRRDGYGGRR